MIYDKASLAQIPSGVGINTLFSVVPNTSAGDFAYSGATNGTRVNKDGLIETIPANVPRLNYNFINGVVQDDPTLLLEPQRTNLIEYSEDFSQSYWNKTLISVTANDSVSPDGSVTADKIVSGNSTGFHFFGRTGLTYSATDNTFSIFAKFTDDLFKQFHFVIYDGSNHFVFFDVKNGNVISADSGVTASMINYGNGWYRCIASYQTAPTSAGQIKVELGDSTNVTGDGSSGMLFWGIQWEVGSYQTSYIKTQGETNGVTRSVDNAQIASGAEGIIGSQNEGTLFIDLEIPYDTTLTDYFQFSISDQNALDNRVFINFRSGEAKFQVFSGNPTVGVGFCNTPTPKNIRLKIAGSYETDNFVLFKDGFLADDIDTGGTVNFTTQMESIRYADQGNGLKSQAKVYQTMFFKEALTQDELETLTSYRSFNEMATQQLYIIE